MIERARCDGGRRSSWSRSAPGWRPRTGSAARGARARGRSATSWLRSSAADERRRLVAIATALALVGLGGGRCAPRRSTEVRWPRRIGERRLGSCRRDGPRSLDALLASRYRSRCASSPGVRVRERALLELHSGRAPPRGAVLEIVRARLGRAARARDRLRRARLARAARHPRRAARRHGTDRRPAGWDRRRRRPAARARRTHARPTARTASGCRSCAASCSATTTGSTPRSSRPSGFGLAHMTGRLGSERRHRRRRHRSGWPWLLGIGRAGIHVLAIAAIVALRARRRLGAVGRPRRGGRLRRRRWPGSRRGPTIAGTALALGALVLLAWQPASLLEPGFQLSFAAVAAILVVVPRAQAFARGLSAYPRRSRSASPCRRRAASATAPISWLAFRRRGGVDACPPTWWPSRRCPSC